MSENWNRPDISVIICTHNRADSLRVTLEMLAAADSDGIRAEVVVVDNASSDNTREVVFSFRDSMAVRYLYEEVPGESGKSRALNRALDAGGLGEIVAVLDDDISPHPDWFKGVMAISGRWPDKDIFTGNTYIIWPSEDVPGWAKRPRIQSWLFSASSFPKADTPLEAGRWFLGGHFWFRSKVLEGGRRFRNLWLGDADFQLDLVEQGFSGIVGREASAGHRVQPGLLCKDEALIRARKVGSGYAWMRLQPYRAKIKQGRLLREHPILGRIFCLLSYARWRLSYFASYLYPSESSRFGRRLIATERMTTYRELFRAANRLGDYPVRKRGKRAGGSIDAESEPGDISIQCQETGEPRKGSCA